MIVKMEESHIDEVARLESICFSEPWSEKSLREEITNRDAVFLVNVKNGRVAGYGGMHTPAGDCYIDNIAVFPEFRGTGVGRELLAALIDEAVKTGGSFISLEVRPSNEIAVSLYQSMGFAEAGRRKKFYQNPAEDGLILTKILL